MNQNEVNRIITEKVLGECWHILHMIQDGCYICTACGKEYGRYCLRPINPDFSQWEHYGPLLEKIQGEGYWRELAYRESAQGCFRESLLNPTTGSHAIAEFVVAHSELFGEVE